MIRRAAILLALVAAGFVLSPPVAATWAPQACEHADVADKHAVDRDCPPSTTSVVPTTTAVGTTTTVGCSPNVTQSARPCPTTTVPPHDLVIPDPPTTTVAVLVQPPEVLSSSARAAPAEPVLVLPRFTG